MRRLARTRGETLTRNDYQLTLIWLYVRRKVTYITNMQKLIELNNIDQWSKFLLFVISKIFSSRVIKLSIVKYSENLQENINVNE